MQSKHMGPHRIIRVRKTSSGSGLEGATLGKRVGEKKGEICRVSYLCGVSHPFYFHGNKHSFLLTNINIFSSCLLRDALF